MSLIQLRCCLKNQLSNEDTDYHVKSVHFTDLKTRRFEDKLKTFVTEELFKDEDYGVYCIEFSKGLPYTHLIFADFHKFKESEHDKTSFFNIKQPERLDAAIVKKDLPVIKRNKELVSRVYHGCHALLTALSQNKEACRPFYIRFYMAKEDKVNYFRVA